MKTLILLVLYFISESKAATVTCDFEKDTCGWTPVPTTRYVWNRMEGNSGPGMAILSAHSGKYYIDISSETFQHKTDYGVLASHYVTVPEDTYFSFWLHNYGKFGHLNLILNFGNVTKLLWNSPHLNEPVQDWIEYNISIPSFSRAQFIFNGSFDSSTTYYLGLDDIVLQNEFSEPTTLPIPKTTYPTTSSTNTQKSTSAGPITTSTRLTSTTHSTKSISTKTSPKPTSPTSRPTVATTKPSSTTSNAPKTTSSSSTSTAAKTTPSSPTITRPTTTPSSPTSTKATTTPSSPTSTKATTTPSSPTGSTPTKHIPTTYPYLTTTQGSPPIHHTSSLAFMSLFLTLFFATRIMV